MGKNPTCTNAKEKQGSATMRLATKRKENKMKTIKNFTFKTKITALILALMIIFYLVPMSVFAEGISTDTGGEVSHPETLSTTDGYTYHKDVYEVIELREESVKHFRLEDGSYVAVQPRTPSSTEAITTIPTSVYTRQVRGIMIPRYLDL